ncbi:MAG: HEAT repeat domain-containing protein [Sedimentisphaerales bacterium]|nr:HEAT repeat domain-containing protein [Sedimentisphaerales bacterium]
MVRRNFLFVAILALSITLFQQSILKADPPIDHYISTGDNRFVCTWLPIESPNSIEASFDLLKDLWKTRRIYWRGLQEVQDWKTFGNLPEPNIVQPGCYPRSASFWHWIEYLAASDANEAFVVQAAHDRGMELWGMGNLFDWGGGGDIPVNAAYGYPLGWESPLRRAHREWLPVDKYDCFKQAGPFELAYPEARQAIIDTYVELAVEADYDGVFFLTYAENHGMRFQDQYGYNEPIVKEFKNRYGVDIRREPFNKTDWINLRGEYMSQFLAELKTALSAHGIDQGLGINQNSPTRTQQWPYTGTIFRTGGEVDMDYETWINDQTADELMSWGNSALALDLKDLAQGTGTEVSLLTSSPYGYLHLGIPVVSSYGDEIMYLLRSQISAQPLSALSDPNIYKRMRVLAQIIDGQTSATSGDVIPLASDSNLLVRKWAMRALGVIGEPAGVPILEAGLFDSETAVRNGAVLGLQSIRSSNTATQILNAVDQHGNFMFNNVASTALAYCTPATTVRAQLADKMQNHSNPMVRETAARTLAVFMSDSDVAAAFVNVLVNDPCDNIRQYAAEGLGNIFNYPAGVQALIDAVGLDNVAVSERSVQALGKKVGFDPAAEAVRPQILNALSSLFEKLAEPGCLRSDVDWGYRPIGDALLAMGDDGRAVLESYYNQRKNPHLAQMAWLVLYMPQEKGDFTVMTEEEYDAVFEKRPPIYDSPSELARFAKEWLGDGFWP